MIGTCKCKLKLKLVRLNPDHVVKMKRNTVFRVDKSTLNWPIGLVIFYKSWIKSIQHVLNVVEYSHDKLFNICQVCNYADVASLLRTKKFSRTKTRIYENQRFNLILLQYWALLTPAYIPSVIYFILYNLRFTILFQSHI